MGTIINDSGMDYIKCALCGELFTGSHICPGYIHSLYYTASTGDIIEKLSKIEVLLQKIYEELRTKR